MKILFLVLVLMAAPALALTVTVQGQASGHVDRVAVLLYIKTEVRTDGSTEKRLDQIWNAAREWLNHFGIKDDQITLREPVLRSFQDQKKYLVRKLSVMLKLTEKHEQDLEQIARLVDQASARGLVPVSELTMVAQDADVVASPAIPDVQNHFVFFLPADENKLVASAVKDGQKKLLEEARRFATVAHLSEPRLQEMTFDNSVLQSTDLRNGLVGVASLSCSDVRVEVPVTGQFETPTSKGQLVSVSGNSRIPVTPQRAVIETRLTCGDTSLVRALARLVDESNQLENNARQNEGVKIELGGIAFFSGNASAFGLNDSGEGLTPSGAYRDVRLALDRNANEAEADFRRRIEKLASETHPKLPPETVTSNENAFMQVFWMGKSDGKDGEHAMAAAVANARENASRILAALSAKADEVVDIDVTAGQTTLANNVNLDSMSHQFSQDSDFAGAIRLADQPVVTATVTLKIRTSLSAK